MQMYKKISVLLIVLLLAVTACTAADDKKNLVPEESKFLTENQPICFLTDAQSNNQQIMKRQFHNLLTKVVYTLLR